MSVTLQRMSPFHKGTRRQESWDQQTEIYTYAHTRTSLVTVTLREDFVGGGPERKTKWAMLASWATQTATHTYTEQTVLAVVTLMCPLS